MVGQIRTTNMPKLDRNSQFTTVTPGFDGMQANRNFEQENFRVWACDNQIYGPVEWTVLMNWAQEGRVTRDTWIYLEGTQEWRQAHKIEALHDCFPPGETTMFIHKQALEE